MHHSHQVCNYNNKDVMLNSVLLSSCTICHFHSRNTILPVSPSHWEPSWTKVQLSKSIWNQLMLSRVYNILQYTHWSLQSLTHPPPIQTCSQHDFELYSKRRGWCCYLYTSLWRSHRLAHSPAPLAAADLGQTWAWTWSGWYWVSVRAPSSLFKLSFKLSTGTVHLSLTLCPLSADNPPPPPLAVCLPICLSPPSLYSL